MENFNYDEAFDGLGIQIITALKIGIWTKPIYYNDYWRTYYNFEKANKLEHTWVLLEYGSLKPYLPFNRKGWKFQLRSSIMYNLNVEDYRKTWWLSKEDYEEALENEEV